VTGVPTDRPSASAAATAEANALAALTIAGAIGGQHAGGVDAILSPGSRNTPLAIALSRSPAVRLHVVLDERAAGFVALGMAKASGRATVLCCTSGSAGGHYLPAVMEASEARVPLVAVTANRPAELHSCGAPQTAPQAGMFAPWARLSLVAATPSAATGPTHGRRLAAMVSQLFAAAEGSPAGPVHLDAPFRKPLWPDSVPELPPIQAPRRQRATRRLSDDQLGAIASRLGHKRGLITCGPLTPATSDASALREAVAQCSARLGWPVLADPASGIRFGGPNGRSPSLAHHDLVLRHGDTARALIPDVVLHVGGTLTSKALQLWLADHAVGCTLLLDPDGKLQDPHSLASDVIAADPADTLTRLVTAPAPSSWSNAWRDADACVAAILDEAAPRTWQGHVARVVTERLPDGGLAAFASSMPIRQVDAFAAARSGSLDVLASRGVNGIDGTLATFLGAMLARRQRGKTAPGLALVGDLAFLHDLDGLLTWGQLGAELAATVVVVDNGGGRIFDWLPIASQLEPDAYEALFVTPQRANIGALCQAFGHRHHRIPAERLAATLDAELERPGLGVIVVPIDAEADAKAQRDVLDAVDRALSDRMPVERKVQT
jgi:2-succinyl-5-enolpyruvyl-6-hydroxy-3-cyclohexene-1-carboxylate synthase